MYKLNTQDGYIVSIVRGVSSGNITEEEYNAIKSVLATRPTAPEGYGYRLKTDLTWELAQLPPVTEEDEPATLADYRAALGELGVTLDE